jgi:hypothetical protein
MPIELVVGRHRHHQVVQLERLPNARHLVLRPLEQVGRLGRLPRLTLPLPKISSEQVRALPHRL